MEFKLRNADSGAFVVKNGEMSLGLDRRRFWNSGPVLHVQDLSIELLLASNTWRRIIDNVSFQIKRSSIVGLCGESGCGKTTLALALLKVLPCRYRMAGSIALRNRDLRSMSERELESARGAEIAMMFQDPLLALNPVLRVCDQVAEVIRAHCDGSGPAQTPGELFRRVGLPDSRRIHSAYPHQLSGGERQRVALAQALAANPALVIADEPFTAVDAARVVELCMLFRQLREQTGVSFLVISHSPEVLATIADEVLVMYAGRIVERGPSRELFRDPLHPFTKGLMQCMPQWNGSGRDNRSRRLIPIPGNPAEPAAVSSGCPFEPRCSDRMETCTSKPPPVFELGASRSVRCFRYAS